MKKLTFSDRYNLIDVIRAAAIISMIAYHLCYDIFVVYVVDPDFYTYLPVFLWERSISYTFLIVSGISLCFSRHPYRRGIIVNLCGLLVTVISLIFLPSQQIWFGVLNLIGCGMMITYALRGLLDRVSPVTGIALCMAAYALTEGVPAGFIGIFSFPLIYLPDVLYSCDWFAFIGFHSGSFFSSDYFPLLPWLFLYIFGRYLWRFITSRGWQTLFYRDVPALSFIGRHSLIIYLVHQPVLYLICAAIFGHF